MKRTVGAYYFGGTKGGWVSVIGEDSCGVKNLAALTASNTRLSLMPRKENQKLVCVTLLVVAPSRLGRVTPGVALHAIVSSNIAEPFAKMFRGCCVSSLSAAPAWPGQTLKRLN